MRSNGTVKLIGKSDAAAKLRGGSKGSAELLANRPQPEAEQVEGESEEVLLPASRFSNRSRN